MRAVMRFDTQPDDDQITEKLEPMNGRLHPHRFQRARHEENNYVKLVWLMKNVRDLIDQSEIQCVHAARAKILGASAYASAYLMGSRSDSHRTAKA